MTVPAIRILIVEDNRADARLVEHALARAPDISFELEIVSRVSTARRRLAEVSFDLILLDLTLPDSVGVDTYTEIREAAPTTAVVLLTGLDDQSVAAELLKRGAQDFLVKGNILPADLVRTVQYAQERQNGQRILQEREREYRHLIEHAQGFICRHDLSGTLWAVNPAAAKNLGYRPDAMIGRKLHDLMPPDEWHLAELYLERVKRTGADNGVLPFQTVTGDRRLWAYRNIRCDPPGEPSYVVGSAYDVTEAKRRERGLRSAKVVAELELELTEAKSEAILAAIPDLMLVISEGGLILDCRAADPSTLFAPAKEFLGVMIDEVFPKDTAKTYARKVRAALQSGSLQLCEYRLSTPGGLRDFEVRFVPAGTDEVVAIVRDVTDSARVQRELQRARTMAALGELVAGVAHEVRNPLFSISATIDAMAARLDGDREFHPHLEVLRGEIDRLRDLMYELLEYGRPSSPNLEPDRIETSVDNAVTACKALAEDLNVSITNRAYDTTTVLMDRSRLSHAFENLLSNALHHAPTGSEVIIDADVSAGDGGDSRVTFTVSDAGPGFHEEDLVHVFEPFYTRRRGGTGLGLAIAARIIEQHNGRISVENRPEGGGMAKVILPCLEASSVGTQMEGMVHH